jgi:hypothetical protein
MRTICKKTTVAVMRSLIALAFTLLALAIPVSAHVGSPDVYFQGMAGPYKMIVTVRTPPMIPGIANVEVIGETPGISRIQVVPLYIAGRGSKYLPAPDTLSQSKANPQYFSGSIWLMDAGSWQVRLLVNGPRGRGEIAVPVAAFARTTLPMQRSLGALLFGLMVMLVAAAISISGAAAREGTLAAGQSAGIAQTHRGRITMLVTAAIVIAILLYGRHWWNSEATRTADRKIYSPPPLAISLQPGGKLLIQIGDSKWHDLRPNTVMTQLIPDHGYLMHFFLIRLPNMDRFYHLHPVPAAADTFTLQLPAVPAGHYQVFADIVRESGFPDTMVAQIDLPDIPGVPLVGDNSAAIAEPFSGASAAADRNAIGASAPVSLLPDGYRMVWERDSAPIANRFVLLRFQLQDASGKPATGVEPYMGMAGHAEIVRSDQSVFAHIHPEGSISMAALELAEKSSGITDSNSPAASNQQPAKPGMAGMDGMIMAGAQAGKQMQMPGMDMNSDSASPDVSFPYGFPKPGEYRLFIQMRRAGHVETGVFDVHVQ